MEKKLILKRKKKHKVIVGKYVRSEIEDVHQLVFTFGCGNGDSTLPRFSKYIRLI